ncbi:MAG: hypothetical protein DWQ07_24330 [Chloroflexi bacterium]|nr:MAG: hypothetical protein DWQ07_24330 [Chloroflexota bacterium]MBL1196262.1 hypothetical protein [Chloroflexota bacterium]NOH13557.1 hypothetical protein [Chloroflexota bacterium]
MQTLFSRHRILLVGGSGIIISAVLACALFFYSNNPFSIYPNADFERVEDFSISRDTFPFIITAPSKPLPPCVRVSFQVVFSTGDRPRQVAEWFQEDGWTTGVGDGRASGRQSSVTNLPFMDFATWMWVAIKEQAGGQVLIEIDRVHVVCVFL